MAPMIFIFLDTTHLLDVKIFDLHWFFEISISAFISNWDKNSVLRRGFVACFYPRTRPRISLQCFALGSHCSEAKLCRDVLGCVLG